MVKMRKKTSTRKWGARIQRMSKNAEGGHLWTWGRWWPRWCTLSLYDALVWTRFSHIKLLTANNPLLETLLLFPILQYSVENSLNRKKKNPQEKKNPDIPHFCESPKNIADNISKSLKPSSSMAPCTQLVSFPATSDCRWEEVTNWRIKNLHCTTWIHFLTISSIGC